MDPESKRKSERDYHINSYYRKEKAIDAKSGAIPKPKNQRETHNQETTRKSEINLECAREGKKIPELG